MNPRLLDDLLFEHNGVQYVPVKAVCRTLGLALRSQLGRIKRDPVLSEGSRLIARPSRGGPQETLCMRLPVAVLWLSRMNMTKVGHKSRALVLACHQDCVDVLSQHP